MHTSVSWPRAKPQYETVKVKDKDGREVESQQVLWGGTREGRPVGSTRYYLGTEFISM